ncbi:transglycosylase SLT domain-containing protein [Priestia sp. SB1]|uniref:transglycosylase SLT domain-containing protein n=1 Tax=Priestia sp. SB1 TaxID=3132359 RepID=UPI0031805799
MDITNIQSTLSELDISALKTALSNKNVQESEFESIISAVAETAKTLEGNYNSKQSLFPEHNFKKIAFQQIVDDFNNKQTTTGSSLTTDSTAKNSTTNNNFSTLSNPAPNNSTNTSNIMETNNIAATTNSVTNTSSTLPIKQISGNTTYDPAISEMAQKYNVPFDLIKAVINAESSFNPNATSSTGAMGLMQLMPSTAKWLGVNDAYNARENIEGGAKYLSYLLKRFDGDFKLAVAGYNAGPGNVEKYKGIPPFQETQNYVKKILT